jgi:hypothetical protein
MGLCGDPRMLSEDTEGFAVGVALMLGRSALGVRSVAGVALEGGLPSCGDIPPRGRRSCKDVAWYRCTRNSPWDWPREKNTPWVWTRNNDETQWE